MSVEAGSGAGALVQTSLTKAWQAILSIAEKKEARPDINAIAACQTMIQVLCEELDKEIKRLQDRLSEIEGGEQGTGTSTTPTCGSTEKGLPHDMAVVASTRAEHMNTGFVSGDVCPTCGHRLKPLSNAERQRRYRERHK